MAELPYARHVPGRGMVFSSPRDPSAEHPSITGVVAVLDKPELVGWAARAVSEHVVENPVGGRRLPPEEKKRLVKALAAVPWEERDRARGLGKEVHGLIAGEVRGGPVPRPSRDAAPIMEAWHAFVDDFGVEHDTADAVLFNDTVGYAGPADAVVRFRDRTLVVDYRVSGAEDDRRRIYRDSALACCAAANAEYFVDGQGTESGMPHVDAAVGVSLCPDGYSVHPLRIDDDVFEAFKGLRAAWDVTVRRSVVNSRVNPDGLAAAIENTRSGFGRPRVPPDGPSGALGF